MKTLFWQTWQSGKYLNLLVRTRKTTRLLYLIQVSSSTLRCVSRSLGPCLDSCSTDTEKPITSGFFRLLKGTPLVYTYTYHEMKIIVEGEFDISDDQGNKVHATPGDVFYFPKGSKITFETESMGLGFFCGQRKEGEA